MGLFSFTQEIAIDLGTANTIIICDDKIVVDEPSVVAISMITNEMVAVGRKAQQMIGKGGNMIRTVRPLRKGVIADFQACEMMIRGLVKMIPRKNKLFMPSLKMVVCIPSGSTEVELRAVRDSAEHAGGRDVFLLYEPMAAAIGIGMSTDQGGPISKAVALVANGLNADGILGPAACKMCGGMQNPLGVCFAQIIDRFAGKKKFTEKERSTTVSGLVLACCYIQEYVIPFLVQDTWRCIVPCMIGGAISGGLCGYFALESAAVHGGVFVIPMMSNPLQFILFWFAGAAVNGILYFLLRKPVDEEGDMAGNGVLDQLLG